MPRKTRDLSNLDALKEDAHFWWDRGLDDILSNYVRNRIRGLSWEKDHDYIYCLMSLERCAVRGVRGWADAMWFHNMKNRYPEETKEIFSELVPGWAVREEKRLDQEKEDEILAKKERAQEKIEEKGRRDEEKEIWVQMGGMP